ncbi:hypothetical protein DNTS_018474, partial [Danionella cerebrum]
WRRDGAYNRADGERACAYEGDIPRQLRQLLDLLYISSTAQEILIFLVVLRHISAVPQNRFLLSSNEQVEDLHADGWLGSDLSANPFLRFTRSRPLRNLSTLNSHHLEKRRCNTATCVTQRLADFLVRSSNTIGTVYVPTNVGSNTYGKRDLQPSTMYLPF